MKSLALISALLAIPLLAAPPVKPAKSRYTPLWSNSPFTAKPIINAPSGPPPVNPMDDYALGGVTQFPDGYFVILINKKDPTEKITVQPGVHSEFKVLSVNMGVDSISEDGKMINEGASVKLANGSMQGEVKYDDKIMAMKGASANPAQPNVNVQGNRAILTPGGIPPGIPTPNNGGIRPGRMRTIPPPTQTNQVQVPQPQVPQPQVPQGSPAQPFPAQQ
jgi:hypothetical protein